MPTLPASIQCVDRLDFPLSRNSFRSTDLYRHSAHHLSLVSDVTRLSLCRVRALSAHSKTLSQLLTVTRDELQVRKMTPGRLAGNARGLENLIHHTSYLIIHTSHVMDLFTNFCRSKKKYIKHLFSIVFSTEHI